MNKGPKKNGSITKQMEEERGCVCLLEREHDRSLSFAQCFDG